MLMTPGVGVARRLAGTDRDGGDCGGRLGGGGTGEEATWAECELQLHPNTEGNREVSHHRPPRHFPHIY